MGNILNENVPKISVIIPVYNTEKYLKKCVESVLNQTLMDIEAICIDDASTDNSLEILKIYARDDERVKLISLSQNAGPGKTRNIGIDSSCGKYIGFVDSDDFIDLDFYEKLYKKALDSNADIVKGEVEIKDYSGEIKYNPLNSTIRKNSGLKAATGKYILFHDHDDIMTTGALNRLYNEFKSDIMAVEAKVKEWYSPDLSEKERRETPIKEELYWGLFTGAILIKKEVFNKIGYFNENIEAGEIIQWHSKMVENNFKIKKIDFVSTKRRVHATNFGKINKQLEFKNYATILRTKIKK